MTNVLIETRLAQLAADEGGAFEKVAVPKTLLRHVLALLEERKACPYCETPKPFDVVAHEQVPSRLNPLASAAALNMVKAAADCTGVQK